MPTKVTIYRKGGRNITGNKWMGKSKRSGGRGRRAYKLSRFGRYNLHSYKRWSTPTLFQVSQPATAYNNVLIFDLSQVRNSSELTALYDQYMITGVKVFFQLVNNPDANNQMNNTTNTNAANIYPKLFYSRDYDNSTVESTNDLRERNTTKIAVLRPNTQYSVFLRPAIRNQVYLDGVTTATSPIWKSWLDCSSTQVPHYGLKFSVEFSGTTTASDYWIRTEVLYYVKFKNAR